jgi:hypothetical protein
MRHFNGNRKVYTCQTSQIGFLKRGGKGRMGEGEQKKEILKLNFFTTVLSLSPKNNNW